MNYNTLLNDQYDIEIGLKKKALSSLKNRCKDEEVRMFVEAALDDGPLKSYIMMFMIDYLSLKGMHFSNSINYLEQFIEAVFVDGYSFSTRRSGFNILRMKGNNKNFVTLLELAKENYATDQK